jgi:hypothetical protein
MNAEKEAFFEVCRNAEPARSSYVSLYVNRSYYGGPEEGGWWGADTELIASQECSNDVEAQAILAKVQELAAQKSKDAKQAYNQACRAQCEWLEARGLDDDFLREVDGEDKYWATVESTPGSQVRQGNRYYS